MDVRTYNIQLEEFKQHLPLVQALREPGMRARHWEKLSGKLGFHVSNSPDFTLSKLLEMGLEDKLDVIQSVSDEAAKEYQIERALVQMSDEWKTVMFEYIAYRYMLH